MQKTDLTVINIVSTDESVGRQITDSINENLKNSDLESIDYSRYICINSSKF